MAGETGKSAADHPQTFPLPHPAGAAHRWNWSHPFRDLAGVCHPTRGFGQWIIHSSHFHFVTGYLSFHLGRVGMDKWLFHPHARSRGGAKENGWLFWQPSGSALFRHSIHRFGINFGGADIKLWHAAIAILQWRPFFSSPAIPRNLISIIGVPAPPRPAWPSATGSGDDPQDTPIPARW